MRDQEIDYSAYDQKQLLHFLKLRDRQAVMSRDRWIGCAKKALDGDLRDLRLQYELATMGPVTLTNGDDEWTIPGYQPPLQAAKS